MGCLEDNKMTLTLEKREKTNININIKENYQLFYKAFIGESEYNSSHKYIHEVEKFLIYWLNGEYLENIEDHLKVLYEQFKDVFPYYGPIYRGIEIKASNIGLEGLRDKYLTSFTDQVEVAKHFAGLSKEYGNSIDKESTSYLIQTISTDCFALDDFLLKLMEITNNIDLQIVIEERIWENEKIAFFQIENCSIS